MTSRSRRVNYALEVACPKCRARKGYACLKPNGKVYESFHIERVQLTKKRNRRWRKVGTIQLGRLEVTVWRDMNEPGLAGSNDDAD